MYTTLIYRCPTSSSCIIALTWDLWDYSEKNDHIKFYCRKYQYFWGLFRYIFEIEEARLFIPALKNFTFDHLTTITISKLSTNVTLFWAKKQIESGKKYWLCRLFFRETTYDPIIDFCRVFLPKSSYSILYFKLHSWYS